MTDRGHETGKIMNGANQYHAESDPEETRQPAESLTGEDRARNRTRSSYSREVLTKKVERFRGNEINVVVNLVRRSHTTVIQLELPGKPPAIEPVSHGEQYDKADCEERQTHFFLNPIPALSLVLISRFRRYAHH